jgi:hypothetical protein
MCYFIIIYFFGGGGPKLYARGGQIFKYGPVYNKHIVYYISI